MTHPHSGAFTTFSTYAVDVVGMIEAKSYVTAAKYVLVNNVGSVGAATGGAITAQAVLRRLKR